MKILSFDTTLETCSVAVLRDEVLLAHRAQRLERGHAEALLPMIEATMAEARLDFSDLDVVAVTVGPGTFTGQRIGLAAARGIGLAQNIPVQGVTTLDAMAYGVAAAGLCQGHEDILVALDARREEVNLQLYRQPLAWPQSISEPIAVPIAELGDHVPAGPCVVVGSGASLIREVFSADGLRFLATNETADAQYVAALALRQIAVAGLPTRPPAPLYLRGPDAKLPGGRSL